MSDNGRGKVRAFRLKIQAVVRDLKRMEDRSREVTVPGTGIVLNKEIYSDELAWAEHRLSRLSIESTHLRDELRGGWKNPIILSKDQTEQYEKDDS